MIDTKTIMLSMGMTTFLMSFIMYGVVNFQKKGVEEFKRSGVADLMFSYILLGIGFVLTATKTILHEFPIIISSGVGSILMMSSIYLILVAIIKIKNLTNIKIKIYTRVFILYSIVQLFLVFIEAPFLIRTLVFSMFSGLFFFMSFIYLREKKNYIDEDKSTNFANFIMTVGFLGYFISILFRAVIILLSDNWQMRESSLFDSSLPNVILALVNFIGFNLISFGFLFLFWQRTQIELVKNAETDWLTQVLNRRAIESSLNKLYPIAQKQKKSISFVLMDLDNFKKINDIYGHAMGDMVLRDFSLLAKKSLKDNDFLGRFGGEEFLMVFFDKSEDYVREQIAKLLKDFEGINFETNVGVRNFTFSAGISSAPNMRGYEDYYELIKQADMCLYKAKNSGKNCFVCY